VITAKTAESLERAYKKTYMEFSKIIVGLNRILDTPQIKMCANKWATINHTKSSCLTIYKSRAAFMNYSKRRGPVLTEDRFLCAQNFADASNNRPDVSENKPSKYDMCHIVESAIQKNIANGDIDEKWSQVMHGHNNYFENMVAMVDMSASMCMEHSVPLYTALGLGVAIAEKSCLGRRILSFSKSPAWISLEKCGSFSECINTVTASEFASAKSTIHIYMALNEILYECIHRKIPDKTVAKMAVFIATDVDLHIADAGYHTEMLESMRERYMETGGYSTMPHILFWNLSQGKFDYCNGTLNAEKNVFPKISVSDKITTVSGFSDDLLNAFIKKGMTAFLEMTPWKMLSSIVDNPRYSLVDDFFES
jgi:hypothetical protein